VKKEKGRRTKEGPRKGGKVHKGREKLREKERTGKQKGGGCNPKEEDQIKKGETSWEKQRIFKIMMKDQHDRRGGQKQKIGQKTNETRGGKVTRGKN